ncbi:MAG: hypothetical protein RBS10_10240 [Thauera propionica]|jgi:hypothetical protein|uniref:hypothetical protein n=2 Tax=Thauera TaxID=33057 RepID=UPI0023F1E2C8|nr:MULTISPECIES: hypothetical protein [Thauera]MDD3674440.1 hypothetical protein [Thauera propionica]MDI3490161.1 hypothetical protein [Thauera sp.]MDY0047779.1 hypothetical protein [Thauera propionica]
MKAIESRPSRLARFAAPGLAVAGLVVTASLLIGSTSAVDAAETALDRVRRAVNQIDAELAAASSRAETARHATAHWQALEALARTPDPRHWSRALQETVERHDTGNTPTRVVSTSLSPPRPLAGAPASLLLRSEIIAGFSLRHEGHLPRLLEAIESTPHVRARGCRLERVVSQYPARINADCRLLWLSVALPANARTP